MALLVQKGTDTEHICPCGTCEGALSAHWSQTGNFLRFRFGEKTLKSQDRQFSCFPWVSSVGQAALASGDLSGTGGLEQTVESQCGAVVRLLG